VDGSHIVGNVGTKATHIAAPAVNKLTTDRNLLIPTQQRVCIVNYRTTHKSYKYTKTNEAYQTSEGWTISQCMRFIGTYVKFSCVNREKYQIFYVITAHRSPGLHRKCRLIWHTLVRLLSLDTLYLVTAMSRKKVFSNQPVSCYRYLPVLTLSELKTQRFVLDMATDYAITTARCCYQARET
jgi:hypothetical protein